MASNPLPDGIDPLFTLAEDMADGLNAHQAAIGIAQNTETRMRADLAAAQTAQTNYLAARSNKIALTTTQTVADSNAKAFIGTARDVLATSLGGQWSQAWEATGFPNQSLAVPSQMAERQALLAALGAYFTANLTKENAPLNVTAARAGTLFTALSDARSAVNAGLVDIGKKRATREAALRTLRLRMRGLIDELTQLLEPDDPRWQAFGLVEPAGSDQPGTPGNVTLTPGAPGILHVDWANAPRAGHYRLYKLVVGIDADFVLAATVTDSEVTLTGLPSGSTVRIRIVAVNAQGDESQPSAVVQIVVP